MYTLRALQDTIQVSTTRDPSKPPTITRALSFAMLMLTHKEPSAVVLLSASSNKTDLQGAVMAANEMKQKGHTLITLGLGTTVDNTDLGNLASPSSAFSSQSFAPGAALGKSLTVAICNSNGQPTTTTPAPQTTTTKS
uniref:VWFA domain-containing protein n=1 Tax=Steinernema glaseri TaxID=37863 RepID=A0A1I7Y733_9BILA